VVWGDFLVAELPREEVFYYTKIHSLRNYSAIIPQSKCGMVAYQGGVETVGVGIVMILCNRQARECLNTA
jgi:hypothetical protein